MVEFAFVRPALASDWASAGFFVVLGLDVVPSYVWFAVGAAVALFLEYLLEGWSRAYGGA